RDAAEDFWQGEHADSDTVGSYSFLRDVLGAVPGARIQAARDAGHYALRSQPDAGVCDAGNAAHPRTGVEARIPRPRRHARRDSCWRVSVGAAEPGDGRE